jgi:hypothetical protein
MQLRKSEEVLLKSIIFLVPIQLFFLFFIFKIAHNLAHNRIMSDFVSVWVVPVVIVALFFSWYILVGFFLNTLRKRVNVFIMLSGIALVSLILIAHHILYVNLIFEWSLLKTLERFFNIFGLFLFPVGFIFLAVVAFAGILIGSRE